MTTSRLSNKRHLWVLKSHTPVPVCGISDSSTIRVSRYIDLVTCNHCIKWWAKNGQVKDYGSDRGK